MKKLRTLVSLLAVMSMASFITGCGDDDDDDNGGGGTPTQFAPTTQQAFVANIYTINLDNGGTRTLRFENGNYFLSAPEGAEETGTFTASRNGNTWTVSADPTEGPAAIAVLTFTGNNAGTFSLDRQGASEFGLRGSFTATPNGGSTNGETDGGTDGETDGGTDGGTEIPTDLSGRRLQLNYESSGFFYNFTGPTTGISEDGGPITYVWDPVSTNIDIQEQNSASQIDLNFASGSNSSGTFTQVFTETGGTPQEFTGSFTLGVPTL